MPQTLVKPKVGNYKRNPSPTAKLAGYKDYIAIALSLDISTRPTRPEFTGTIEGKAFATAVAATPATAFGSTAVWAKLEVEVGTLSITAKPVGNLKENSGDMTEIKFEVIDTDEMQGQLNLLRSAPLEIVAETNAGQFVWCGDADSNVYITEISRENTSAKKRIAVTMQFTPLSALYLPTGTTISYVS